MLSRVVGKISPRMRLEVQNRYVRFVVGSVAYTLLPLTRFGLCHLLFN